MKKLKYGNTNTYYVNGLLIDTDMPGTMLQFFKELKSNDISINDIHYILATHYHPDHVGLVSELMDMGKQLIIVEHQLEQVHFSDEIFHRQYGNQYHQIDEKRAIIVSAEKSRTFLASIDIQGEIIPTTSHSVDGIVLILDDGNCFVGDLEPQAYIDAYEHNATLERDWKKIRDYQPKVIHFGHANDQIFKN